MGEARLLNYVILYVANYKHLRVDDHSDVVENQTMRYGDDGDDDDGDDEVRDIINYNKSARCHSLSEWYGLAVTAKQESLLPRKPASKSDQ